MRILDKYILKSVCGLFFTCLLTFFCLYIVIDVLSHLQDILKHKVPLEILLRYYLAYLPIIFTQVSPIACLLATLYTFGKLNRDNEIIAMRSCGLSIFQIIKNVLIFGMIISVFGFWIFDKFVPASLSLTEKIKARIESGIEGPSQKENEVIRNLSMYGLKNRLFFISKFYPAAKTLEGITILEHDQNQNIVKKIVATKGEYKDGLWKFYNSITWDFDENGQSKHDPQYLEEEIMAIPESPADFLSQGQRPDFMNIKQLDDYIWKLSKSGAMPVVKILKVDLYQRFTAPLTNILIILLGVPFALIMKKRATGMSSIGISLMVGFLYYVLNAISIALGKAGIIIPGLAASLAHILSLFASLYLINKLP